MRELIGDKPVTIGEAAAHFGLAPSTLRWWEQQGLLVPTELFAGHATTQHWHDTFRDRIREIDRQIEQLATARGWLSHALGCQADDPTRCSHLDSYLDEELDEFAARHLTPGSISTRDMFRHEFRHRHESRDRTRCAPGVAGVLQGLRGAGAPGPHRQAAHLLFPCLPAARLSRKNRQEWPRGQPYRAPVQGTFLSRRRTSMTNLEFPDCLTAMSR